MPLSLLCTTPNTYTLSIVLPDSFSPYFLFLKSHARTLTPRRGSFGHGSTGHHQPQRPVPRNFPLFKRCEWLVIDSCPNGGHPSHLTLARHLSKSPKLVIIDNLMRELLSSETIVDLFTKGNHYKNLSGCLRQIIGSLIRPSSDTHSITF